MSLTATIYDKRLFFIVKTATNLRKLSPMEREEALTYYPSNVKEDIKRIIRLQEGVRRATGEDDGV